MFMGKAYNSIDDKNRYVVPAKQRHELGDRCIVTRGLDKCLYVYPTSVWDEQVEKVMKLPESDPKVRAFVRHYFSNAVECEFDKQGRIVLPTDLIEYAGITKNLVTFGAMTKIEIWAKEVWEDIDNPDRMETKEFSLALREYNF